MTLAPAAFAPARTSPSLLATTTGRSAGQRPGQADDHVVGRHAGRRELDPQVAAADGRRGHVGAVEHDAHVGAVAGGELVEGIEQPAPLLGQRRAAGQPSLATL